MGRSVGVEHVLGTGGAVPFVAAALLWALVGMGVGVIVSLQFVMPETVDGWGWMQYGRLRPVHTNVLLLGFAGNMLFAAVHDAFAGARSASVLGHVLRGVHFWLWQSALAGGAVSLAAGFNQGKEYAEFEWPVDLALVVASLMFIVQVVAARGRQSRCDRVSTAYLLGPVVLLPVVLIGGNIARPVGLLTSFPYTAGVDDAIVHWWYVRMLIGVVVVLPVVGMVYRVLPAATGRARSNRRLAGAGFWSLLVFHAWLGGMHLHLTAAPEWVSIAGMLAAVLVVMPAVAVLPSAVWSVRGVWGQVLGDPVLQFVGVGLVFLVCVVIEGAMNAIRPINAITHATDWSIAHAHAAALGGASFVLFGVMYELGPRAWGRRLWSRRLAAAHLWLAVTGALMYVVPLFAGGLVQGWLTQEMRPTGALGAAAFLETLAPIRGLYWLRTVGGVMVLSGGCVCAMNLMLTRMCGKCAQREGRWDAKPGRLPEETSVSGSSARDEQVLSIASTLDAFFAFRRHGALMGRPVSFMAMVLLVAAVGSTVQLAPVLLSRDAQDGPGAARAYTPLEQAGREIYIAEGCSCCHTQMVRPLLPETARYGAYARPEEYRHDRPFLWGSRRTGPDLHRVGSAISSVAWHVRHLRQPRETSPGSMMPAFDRLFKKEVDWSRLESRVRALAGLNGADGEEARSVDAEARSEGRAVFARLVAEDESYGERELAETKAMALTAYLLRLGEASYGPE